MAKVRQVRERAMERAVVLRGDEAGIQHSREGRNEGQEEGSQEDGRKP